MSAVLNRAWHIRNPQNAAERRARNALLQSQLRPENPLFPIESEYPTLLLEESHNDESWCVFSADQLVAHGHLVKKEVVDTQGHKVFRVGLIANIATATSAQGQGVMSHLLDFFKQQAHTERLEALILWSDLNSFYQKRGFSSLGSEIRWTFERSSLKGFADSAGKFSLANPDAFKNDFLAKLWRSRKHADFVIQRSGLEFAKLLQIPETFFFADPNQATAAYAICGKGYDMMGVIHEWSAESPDKLLAMAALVCQTLHYERIMLLTPEHLATEFRVALAKLAVASEVHPMALAWQSQEKTPQRLRGLFLWGLDSI